MKNVFLILLILFGFSQCTEECETCGQGRMMDNYVLKYFVFTDFSSIYISSYTTEDSAGIRYDVVFYNGDLIDCIFPKNENMLAKFHEIAKYNGDTAYCRPISTCFPYTCMSDKAGRFDIYCDTVYAGLPAKTSLNEFCTIYFHSAGEFVKSGYAASETDPRLKQYCMPLTEFNSGNHYLVASNSISFTLNLKPEPGWYIMFVSYSDTVGGKYTTYFYYIID
jgi:hypothetical protein